VSFKFSHEVRVRLSETDGLGVVYHGTFFTYFDVAKMEYLRTLGQLESFRTGEALNLIVHVSADFRSPARFDDLLLVRVRIAKLGASSVTFEFRVELKADGRLIAEGRSIASAIDSKTWKPTLVPESFRAAVRAFEGSALDEKP
jgi:acyl-CoA thioester hydrolase